MTRTAGVVKWLADVADDDVGTAATVVGYPGVVVMIR